MNTPTLFTKIINGEIPSHKIYEDDKTYAFLDIHPLQLGHTLVIPKQPVEFLWDLEEADYLALMKTVQMLGHHLRDKVGTKYVGVRVVGTDVPHAHIHLVPFNTAAEYHDLSGTHSEPDHAVLAEIASKLAI